MMTATPVHVTRGGEVWMTDAYGRRQTLATIRKVGRVWVEDLTGSEHARQADAAIHVQRVIRSEGTR